MRERLYEEIDAQARELEDRDWVDGCTMRLGRLEDGTISIYVRDTFDLRLTPENAKVLQKQLNEALGVSPMGYPVFSPGTWTAPNTPSPMKIGEIRVTSNSESFRA